MRVGRVESEVPLSRRRKSECTVVGWMGLISDVRQEDAYVGSHGKGARMREAGVQRAENPGEGSETHVM